jgi:small subunit ribosomal protein S21
MRVHSDVAQSTSVSTAPLAWIPTRKEVSELAEVVLQDGEGLESALRRFKRKVQQEDIIKEIKKHSYYLKPGERKRVKEALARKRNRKKRSRDIE